ncbi:TPA: hypothetical protein ACKP17_000686 [Serratia marcescens]
MSQFDDMTPEQITEYLKSTGVPVPEWMLDIDRMKSGGKLTDAEVMEFAEFHSAQLRTNAAARYLISCSERFGASPNGQHIFVHQNVVMEISQDVIETLLQHQVEAPLLEERPADRYITVMQFYQMNDQMRELKGSTWLRDFIDEVFIEGAQSMIDGTFNPPSNLH